MDAALDSTVSHLPGHTPDEPARPLRSTNGGLLGPALGSVVVHVAVAASLLGVREVAHERPLTQPASHLVDFELPRLPEPVEAPKPMAEPAPLAHKVAPVRVARPKLAAPEPVAPPPPSAAKPVAPEPPAPASVAPITEAAPTAANAVPEGGSLAVATGTGQGIGGVATRALPAAVGGSGSGAPGSLGSGPGMIDRSRAPQLAGSAQWSDCPFPNDAYDAGIEAGTVKLQVRINASGGVDAVSVLSDPGYGFGHEARRCAMRKRWQVGLDREGKPIAAVAIVNARFAQR